MSTAQNSSYSPDNHGIFLYTYSEQRSKEAKTFVHHALGSYGGLPRAIVATANEDDDEYFFANSFTGTSAYGTKTATGNSRLFNCKHCQRAFTREEHLTRHILLTHNKLKPYVCGICTRPFSRRDLLLRHAKNLHDGSEVAVSRIRKLYKKLEKEDANSRDPAPPKEESPRMKMSVSMLVS